MLAVPFVTASQLESSTYPKTPVADGVEVFRSGKQEAFVDLELPVAAADGEVGARIDSF